MKNCCRQIAGEFSGTLLLGWLGLGVIIPRDVTGMVDGLFPYSWCFGLLLVFAILLFGPISGAQFNPAVTLARIVSGRQAINSLIPFWVAQFLGWGCGAGMALLTFSRLPAVENRGVTAEILWCKTGDLFSGAILEVAGTAFLVTVILALEDHRFLPERVQFLSPLFIGLLHVYLITAFAGFTGTALNPARDLGPRMTGVITNLAMGRDYSVCFADRQWLLYLLAPLAGGIGGGWFFGRILLPLLPQNDDR